MLRLTVPYGVGATPVSFASRLARLNGCGDVRDFCFDMGLKFQDVVDGDADTLARLTELGGAEPRELTRSALIMDEQNSYRLNGQTVARSMLRRTRVRVCPQCIADDMDRWPHLGAAAPYGRVEWQLASFRSCPIHIVGLVDIANNNYASVVHDFTKLVAPKLADALPIIPRQPSRLETYLRDRLAGLRDGVIHWLDEFPFYAAARLCEVLGAVSLHGPKVAIGSLDDDQMAEAGNAGFEIALGGPEGIRKLLTRLTECFWLRTGGTGPKAMFGRLYEWLAHETDDTAYDRVRDVIRDFVLDTLPMEPEDEIFGQPVGERRLWSIRTASLATGAHRKRLRKLLIDGGLILDCTGHMTDDRILFVADKSAQEFLDKVKDSMSLKEVGRYINAPRVQLQLLSDHGFLVPFADSDGDVHAYAKQDMDDFLDRLTADAISDAVGCVDIPTASRKARCSAMEIVRLLLDRKLTRVGRQDGVHGYMSVLVDPNEIRQHVFVETRDGLTIRQVASKMGWNDKVVRALVDADHLPCHVVQNPMTHQQQMIVDPADLAAFDAEYVSLHSLAREQGRHFLRIKADVEGAGIRPVFLKAEIPATFYRRVELMLI